MGWPVGFSTFIGGVAACDPQVKYDPKSSRWFYVAIRCDGTRTASALNVEFHGSLKPKETNGSSIGAAPSKLEFNAASGSLESASGAGELTGKLKLLGYEAQELVQVKNP